MTALYRALLRYTIHVHVDAGVSGSNEVCTVYSTVVVYSSKIIMAILSTGVPAFVANLVAAY